MKSKGQIKLCSICGSEFLCLVGGIKDCHCNNVSLTDKQLKDLQKYKNCICNKCLKNIEST